MKMMSACTLVFIISLKDPYDNKVKSYLYGLNGNSNSLPQRMHISIQPQYNDNGGCNLHPCTYIVSSTSSVLIVTSPLTEFDTLHGIVALRHNERYDP